MAAEAIEVAEAQAEDVALVENVAAGPECRQPVTFSSLNYFKKKYSGVHPRVSTLIQPSFQKKKKKKKKKKTSNLEKQGRSLAKVKIRIRDFLFFFPFFFSFFLWPIFLVTY